MTKAPSPKPLKNMPKPPRSSIKKNTLNNDRARLLSELKLRNRKIKTYFSGSAGALERWKAGVRERSD